MTTWERDFIAWHIATEHPWDVALHVEALSMSVDGIARQIGEALLPAIEKAAASIRAFTEAWDRR